MEDRTCPPLSAEDAPLFERITAHCFWGWCKHTASGLDGALVHEEMERHYASDHRADLDAVLPRVTLRAGVIA